MLKKWLRGYIETNKRDILIVVSLMLIGMIIGIGIYSFTSNEIKEQAITSAKEVFDISQSDTYVKTNIIVNGIKADVMLISIIAILSVTLFGRWIIYIIMALKGMAISVYTILLFNIFGPLWGIVVTLLLVILVNLLYLPALIYLVVTFLEINFNVFKIMNKQRPMFTYKVLLTICLCFVIMFSSLVVEQVASGIVLNIYKKI